MAASSEAGVLRPQILILGAGMGAEVAPGADASTPGVYNRTEDASHPALASLKPRAGLIAYQGTSLNCTETLIDSETSPAATGVGAAISAMAALAYIILGWGI